MGNGDVDRDEFPIPKCLTNVLIRSLEDGYYRYSHPLGRPTTRQLIAEYENYIAGQNIYEQKNVGLVLSATGGFAAAIEILMRHNNFQGDALLMQPSFPVYEAVLWKRFGIRKMIGQEQNGFLPTPDEIASCIDKNTKFIVLTSPNFPFGKTYSKQDLKRIVDLSNKTKTYVILDEIFYDIPFVELANIGAVKESQKYIIRIKGFSKDRAVPGFRIGYVIADESFIHALNQYANHYYGLAPSLFEPFIEKDIIMRMLLKGKKAIKTINLHDLPAIVNKKFKILGDSAKDLPEYKRSIEGTLLQYKRNRNAVIEKIQSIPKMRTLVPDAGFNLGVQIQHTGTTFNFFKQVFLKTGVILAPGEVFDMPKSSGNWYRLTFSNNLGKMLQALERVGDCLK